MNDKTKCVHSGCQDGKFCYGYHPAQWIQTSDEDGYWIQEQYEWGACPCCEGVNWEDCPNCKEKAGDPAA